MITKTGSAHWQGGLKDGKGTIATQSGALNGHPYGFNTRFEGQRGTNPEELIGAAHAACFSMALSGALGEAGITPGSIETTATVSLEKNDSGFAITKVHLDTRITAEGDKAKIQECAQKAKAGCPVSKLLNAEVTLTVSVA